MASCYQLHQLGGFINNTNRWNNMENREMQSLPDKESSRLERHHYGDVFDQICQLKQISKIKVHVRLSGESVN